MPGVIYDQPLPTKLQVAPDLNGLKKLIKAGQLRSAFNLTTRLLSDLGQGPGMSSRPSKNSMLSFEIWSCRFQLLVALRLYNYVLEEIAAFEDLDSPDTFLQFYSEFRENGRSGSMVPFSLRLIHAEILMHTAHPWNAVERIDRLEKNKEAIAIAEASNLDAQKLGMWQKRLDSVLLLKARVYFKLKDFNHSMTIIPGPGRCSVQG
uniref:Uncharacterized protein n=1 Tax=Ditylenchus dipsaci TaxID=166011 RepID=A0A915D667_9BILA